MARADASQLVPATDPVDLTEIVDESCRALRLLIQTTSLHVPYRTPAG